MQTTVNRSEQEILFPDIKNPSNILILLANIRLCQNKINKSV